MVASRISPAISSPSFCRSVSTKGISTRPSILRLCRWLIGSSLVSVMIAPIDKKKPVARIASGKSSSRRELVAEGTTRRALHDGLVAREADLADARRGNIEIGLADQQRAEDRLAERAKERREPACGDVELQR